MWNDINVFFVDRDFIPFDVLNEMWPSKPVLICVFHVINTLKFKIAKGRLLASKKQALWTIFRRVLNA